MRITFLFPGQGSQCAGMGRALIEQQSVARAVIEAAADACGLPLLDYCLKTSDAALRATERAQPALFALGLAIATALREQGVPAPAVYGGHSLGHFTALAASGALSPHDTARLVAARSQLMAKAGARCAGGMTVALDTPNDALDAALLESGLRIWRANDNLPGQTVLSGAAEDLPTAEALIAACGGRFKRLNVSGAFHSPLLDEEAAQFAELVNALPFATPHAAVVRNRDGELMYDAATLRADLRSHMTAPVRWVAVMDNLRRQGLVGGIECGPGKVLKGLMLQYVPGLPVFESENPRAFSRALDMVRPSGKSRDIEEVLA
ncbi:ACP S-malonyltransferase [Verminephrobacter aporrectodeae subsp. tuberculatae]|uniref:ACP S-malonyltransferase n=1 Tax=Verminephrobacter aporrectodeae TaxID=1110389 RepID=UPI0009DABE05|nr:ACP S-malonyltransferase [Verminephrobacter aporrectodeae]MCW8166676.1 ACP S-malonyltransferase [Verminephrobacter aporrectodeae subsp. tuberculatae]MCW8170902.1 ACP S-malonyltransferase [Verminephrobacter aporrectodeae subsp. tuberculatae]MCW8208674.1 ACP S-malonyltransferase [Verminephrobacter aporrectodeae subsp. tuberculatae]